MAGPADAGWDPSGAGAAVPTTFRTAAVERSTSQVRKMILNFSIFGAILNIYLL